MNAKNISCGRTLATVVLAALLAACGGAEDSPAPSTPVPTPTPSPAPVGDASAGAQKYGSTCLGCHGALASSPQAQKASTLAGLNAALSGVSAMASLRNMANQDRLDIVAYIAANTGSTSPAGSAAWPAYNGTKTTQAAHVRRLSNFEFDNAVRDLLGLEANAAAAFVIDTRNLYFTRNNAQRVDDTLGGQLQSKAQDLAASAVQTRLSAILPCAASQGDTCMRQFIDTFGAKAFRRPLTTVEASGLAAVFVVGQTGGSFNDGVQVVVEAVLQSPSFLYLTELGTGSGDTVTLTPYETASALSFLVWGAPPDRVLLDAARTNALSSAQAREAQVRRMLDDPKARPQLRLLVREWLGTDGLDKVSPQVAGLNYSALRPELEKEADAYIDEVFYGADGRLATLLGANFSMLNAPLASHYGLSGPAGSALQRVSLQGTPRRGLMTQGAFLAKHASRDHSSPVKRGAAVLRRMLCRPIEFPTGEIAQRAMMVPPASATQTTRQRFEQHSSDPACSSCHSQLDPIGFGLENFDQSGKFRQTENGLTVNPSGSLVLTDVNGPFNDAAQLVDRLKTSQIVAQCFAQNVYRFASGSGLESDEQALLDIARGMNPESRDQLKELLAAYAASPAFVTRRAVR